MAGAPTSVTARMTFSIGCRDCGSRESHLDVTLPVEAHTNQGELVVILRERQGVETALKCAACDKEIKYGTTPLVISPRAMAHALAALGAEVP